MKEEDNEIEDNTITGIELSINHVSLTRRLHALNKINNIIIEYDSNEKVGPIKRVCRIVCGCLIDQFYNESIWISSLFKMLNIATSQTNFPFKVHDIINEYILENVSKSLLPSTKYKIIEISISLLKSLSNDEDLTNTSIASFISIINDTFESLCEANNIKYITSTTSLLTNLLEQKPTLVPLLFNSFIINNTIGNKKQIDSSILLLTPYLNKSNKHNEYFTNVLKHVIIQSYCIRLLESKQSPSLHVLDNYGVFISILTKDDWLNSSFGNDNNESIQDIVLKILKKSPEGSSLVLANLLAAINIDLSALVIDGNAISSSLRPMKASTEDTRVNGILLINNLIMKSANQVAFTTITNTLIGALQGKEGGILSQIYQRQSVFLALTTCAEFANSFGKEYASKLAQEEVLSQLIISMEKEVDDNNRIIVAKCIGDWLSCCTNELSVAIISSIKTSLVKNKNIIKALLLSLIISIKKRNEISQFILDIAPILVNLIKESNKKPLLIQIEGLFSLRLLLEMAVSSSTIQSLIKTEKLWTNVSSSSSFVYNKSLVLIGCPSVTTLFDHNDNIGINTISSVLAESVISILSITATNFPNNLPNFKENKENCVINSEFLLAPLYSSHPGPIGALLSYIHHPNVAVRNEIGNIIVPLLSYNESVSSLLLSSLLVSLNLLSEYKESQQNEINNNFKSSSEEVKAPIISIPVSSHIMQSLFLIVFNYLLVSDRKMSSEVFSDILLLCSHPIVSKSAKRAYSLWNKTLNMSNQLNDTMNDQIVAKLINISANPAASVAMKRSNEIAICILFNKCGINGINLIKNELIPCMIELIKSQDVINIPENDIEKYLNPNIVTGIELLNINIDDIKITNADRKKDSARSSRRGQFGADTIEDEDWAEKIKKEKAQKLIESKTKGDSNAITKLQKENDELKMKIDVLISTTCNLLNIITFVANSNDLFSKECLNELVPTIMPLLRSPLVGNYAYKSMYALSSVLGEELQLLRSDLCHSLRIVSLTIDRPMKKRESLYDRYREILDISDPIVRLFKGVMNIKYSNTTTYIIHFLLPILQGITYLDNLVPGCDFLYAIIDTVWPNNNKFQLIKGENGYIEGIESLSNLQLNVIKICLRGIEKFPKLEPSPESILLRITAQSNLSNDELSLFLDAYGLMNTEMFVRKTCLKILLSIINNNTSKIQSLLSIFSFQYRIWLVKHDSDIDVQTLASSIWEIVRLQLPSDYYNNLHHLLANVIENTHVSAAKAIASGMLVHPNTSNEIINNIKELFLNSIPPKQEKISEKTSKSTKVGALVPIIEIIEDKLVHQRQAIAITISSICEVSAIPMDNNDLIFELFNFIFLFGVVDISLQVRLIMIESGRKLIDSYGTQYCNEILSTLEIILARKPSKTENLDDFDNRNEAAVILLGAVGKHLSKEDPKIVNITEMMVEALKTPSETVQKAVADSLVSLVICIKTTDRVKELLEIIITRVMEGNSYGERRGAAFGLAAFVKGLGIPSLKQHDIITRLKLACEEGDVNSRQGSLFAFEFLSVRLGLLFEPYVIAIVPSLLKSFSHSSDHVREACGQTTKTIMGKLSAHGVKQVLTPILDSLPEEKQWKTRQESIRLLGSMAYCAPRQLSACLPTVVPRLVEAGSDPHPKVKESAKQALIDISSVIRNPEVLQLAPVLLAALSDPAKSTKDALEALLECEFMHSIDVASLALLIPILSRALKDRGADLKRKASAITGNMMTMVGEPKTLVPYLPQLMPGLKGCLLDPIPDVRATSAKALGSLMGVGEAELTDLIPWLINTLKTESSPVERSGAAQGLSEVCLSLGSEKLEFILHEVIPFMKYPKSAAREGLLWLLSFLPAVLREKFAVHLSLALPIVLLGLADENEGVREVSMRAGQVMVSVLGNLHANEIIPELSDGMFHDDWRIRNSSVSLLGELLYLIGDTKAVGLADGEDDEDGGYAGFTSSSRVVVSIRAHIGEAVTNSIFASLYITRSDLSSTVRQISLQVWKSIISNTPKTLVEIMPVLVKQLVEKLASSSDELRIVAGRSLGDVVKKLGDRVLPIIIPCLQNGLTSTDESVRQGVGLGLSEILGAASHKQIEDYLYVLMPALQEALCDKSPDVRSQAAKAFQTLYKSIGLKSVDEIIPALLEKISSIATDDDYDPEDVELALLGLKSVVEQRPRDLLEYLLPKLCIYPMQISSATALGAISTVSGNYFNVHYSMLVSSLTLELYTANNNCIKLHNDIINETDEDNLDALQTKLVSETARFEAIKNAGSAVMASVTNSGVIYITQELGKQIEHETDPRRRLFGIWLTEQYIKKSKAEFTEYIPVLYKYILSRIADPDPEVLSNVVNALLAITSTVSHDLLIDHLEFIRSCITSNASDARHRKGAIHSYGDNGEFLLPLFSINKSLEPLLTIFIHGLMNGSPEIREIAADGIGEFALMSHAPVLKPFLIKTTGPLIRVLGDRFPSNIKGAILKTLSILIDKGGISLKAFAPQLQTTFVKSLSDPSKQVRIRSGNALGKLMGLSTRVDPLLIELTNLCTSTDSNAIRGSVLDALATVLLKCGDKVSEATLEKVKSITMETLLNDDERVRDASSLCITSLSPYLDQSQISDFLITLVDTPTQQESWQIYVGRIMGISAILQGAGQRSIDRREESFKFLKKAIIDDRVQIKTACCTALATMLTYSKHNGVDERKGEYKTAGQATIHAFNSDLSVCMSDKESADVRRAAMIAIKQGSKYYPGATQQYTHKFMPALIKNVQDINIRVQQCAQRTMYHLLDKGTNSALLTSYCTTADSDSSSFVKDYCKRIISKLDEDSDEEATW